MAQISPDRDIVTLINTFTVQPDAQQRLFDLLVKGIRTTFRALPGFVSASIHKSLDGTRVINYAQWESREALETVFQNLAAISYMRQVQAIVENAEPHLYEVSFMDEIDPLYVEPVTSGPRVASKEHAP